MVTRGTGYQDLDQKTLNLLIRDNIIKRTRDEYGHKPTLRSWVKLDNILLAEVLVDEYRSNTIERYPHSRNCRLCNQCLFSKPKIEEFTFEVFQTKLVLISTLNSQALRNSEKRQRVIDEYEERFDEANNSDCYTRLEIEIDEPFIKVTFCKNPNGVDPNIRYFCWENNYFVDFTTKRFCKQKAVPTIFNIKRRRGNI